MILTLSALTERDATILSTALLPLDEEECRASGYAPVVALSRAANHPDPAFTIKDEKGWPIFAFGAHPGRGQMDVWLLAAEGMKLPEARWVLRNMPLALQFLQACLFEPGITVPVRCFVWAHNIPHIKWLLAAGFRPTGNRARRRNAYLFLEFERKCVPL